MIQVKLYFDNEIGEKIKKDKEKSGLSWEKYFIQLFGLTKSAHKVVVK